MPRTLRLNYDGHRNICYLFLFIHESCRRFALLVVHWYLGLVFWVSIHIYKWVAGWEQRWLLITGNCCYIAEIIVFTYWGIKCNLITRGCDRWKLVQKRMVRLIQRLRLGRCGMWNVAINAGAIRKIPHSLWNKTIIDVAHSLPLCFTIIYSATWICSIASRSCIMFIINLFV